MLVVKKGSQQNTNTNTMITTMRVTFLSDLRTWSGLHAHPLTSPETNHHIDDQSVTQKTHNKDDAVDNCSDHVEGHWFGQDFVKWCGEERQKAADGKDDDEEGKDEANGVDSDTPLEPWITRVLAVVQADEDDAGHEGLQDLEEARDCGQEPTQLAGFSSGQPHFNGVQDKDQTGSDCGTDLSAAAGASVEPGIDDGRC
ncbi:hypothetical protein F7725_003554 [Dissostichus mawsoni]|uniref:Uncharacterized protein n=1 Tax=Dissostichus mawsoni TaxID=36200 RepID=A0A7J5YAI5_DISMA|nr:hypothetical protein F7725_003554 [Dissostichus mawsoni]